MRWRPSFVAPRPESDPAAGPPEIAVVRRSFVTARGIRFHVTEAGPANKRPVLALHGGPQHHYAYRHLLADPPDDLRIIAPDLPGYGWSGPAPHRWAKDWGGYIAHLLVLREPERFDALLALNIAHPWQTPRSFLPHAWRFLIYQPPVAAFGTYLHQRTRFLEQLIFVGAVRNRDEFGPEVIHAYADRFRDPLCARTAADTYRTFLLREVPRSAVRREQRRATVPIRALFGVDDAAIHPSLASEKTARADDYRLELAQNCGHFIAEERPDLVRARLVELATTTAHPA
ncbi:alpha/beta fold hydrolase [Nocardia sputi]|uniref:alpha/beta fold hydrolase n=1 Tax=Nocardia sputi TaxID=2943705 RepID=UPI0020C018DD|nr:alpha/beta hydrolase [Nocardia sputi]